MSRTFILKFFLLTILVFLFSFGITHGVNRCATDSIANYFPKPQIENVLKATLNSTKRDDGDCAVQSSIFSAWYTLSSNSVFAGDPSSPYAARIGLDLELEVRMELDNTRADARAHDYYQSRIDLQKDVYKKLNIPIITQNIGATSDEALLLTTSSPGVPYIAFARQGKYVFTVKLITIPQILPQNVDPANVAHVEYNTEAVKTKIQSLLGIAVSAAKAKPGGSGITPGTSLTPPVLSTTISPSQPTSPSKTPNASPPKSVSPTPEEKKVPVITSITSKGSAAILPAGVIDYLAPDGQAIYKPYYGYVTIKGKNLSDAKLTSDNSGYLASNPAIKLPNISSYNNGTTLIVQIVIKPFAKEGKTNIIASNQYGQSKYPINITITGTQWLERRFDKLNKEVEFRGNWDEVAPNLRVINLFGVINDGLRAIDIPGYKKLNIIPVIYNKEYWNETICESKDIPGKSAVYGCASPNDKIIKLRESAIQLPPTFIHESAHKLHFYNRGIYQGTLDAPNYPSRFQIDWVSIVGAVNNQTCKYLPTTFNSVYWNDGKSTDPHCGFIMAYGAKDLKNFYEDVATMAESFVFNPELFQQGDAPNDSRYKNKIDVLKKYEFVY